MATNRYESFGWFVPLLEAGWYPGKRVDISPMVNFYEGNRLALSDKAREFLHSYLGLKVLDVTSSRRKARLAAWFRKRYPPSQSVKVLKFLGWLDRRRDCTVLDFRMETIKKCAFEAEDFGKRLGKQLTVVGREEVQSETLFVDQEGIGYSAFDLDTITSTTEFRNMPLRQLLDLVAKRRVVRGYLVLLTCHGNLPDDAQESIGNTDPNDPVAVKKSIRQFILPQLALREHHYPGYWNGVRDSLWYYLHHQPWDPYRLFSAGEAVLEEPEPIMNFYKWAWEELFGGQEADMPQATDEHFVVEDA